FRDDLEIYGTKCPIISSTKRPSYRISPLVTSPLLSGSGTRSRSTHCDRAWLVSGNIGPGGLLPNGPEEGGRAVVVSEGPVPRGTSARAGDARPCSGDCSVTARTFPDRGSTAPRRPAPCSGACSGCGNPGRSRCSDRTRAIGPGTR